MSDSRARIWFALFVLAVFCLGGAGGFASAGTRRSRRRPAAADASPGPGIFGGPWRSGAAAVRRRSGAGPAVRRPCRPTSSIASPPSCSSTPRSRSRSRRSSTSTATSLEHRPPRGARALRQRAARAARRHSRRPAAGPAGEIRQVPGSPTMTIKSVLLRVRPWLVTSALVFAGLSLGFLTLAASEKPHFESKGLDGAITVDGKFDDWYGNLQPFGSDPVAIQFLNDGEFLYVRADGVGLRDADADHAAGDDGLVRSRRRHQEEIRHPLSGRRARRRARRTVVVAGGGGGGYGGDGGARHAAARSASRGIRAHRPIASTSSVRAKTMRASLTRDHLSGRRRGDSHRAGRRCSTS